MSESHEADRNDLEPPVPDPERLAEIVSTLETVSEQLGDLSIDLLRAAVEQGAGRRPPADKSLSAARRAIDKAIRSLAPTN